MALSPNRKNGRAWQATKDAKVNQRNIAYYETLQAINGAKSISRDKLSLRITFVQNDNRHRDLDNLLSASKSMIDGMAKALGVDDKIFEPITLCRGKGEKCTMIVVDYK